MSEERDGAGGGIDFGKYELNVLGDDIRSIVSVPDAVGQTAKWAFGLPFVIAIVTWVVFGPRMGWPLLPFTFIALFLSFFGAVAIGAFFVARKRLDIVAAATDRVVGVIDEMHQDVVRVQQGHADTSVQAVAIGLLENAIFPAVFGTVSTTAETAMGPLGFLARRVAKAPMNLVQKSTIRAIKALPDKELGTIVDDTLAATPALTEQITTLTNEYQRIRGSVESVVATVSKTASRSILGLAFVAFLPLIFWLIIGWVAS